MKEISDEVVEQIAHRLRAMGNPIRLRILHAVEQGELPVHEIVDRVHGTQANVSKQLGILWNAGLVERRKEGLAVFYRLADDRMIEICRTMCDALFDGTSLRLEQLRQGRSQIRPARSRGALSGSSRRESRAVEGTKKRSSAMSK